jgi:homoserine dehydrogenase
MFFHGLGAGQMPTASAVVADIIDTVVGRAAITFRATGVLDADGSAARLDGGDLHERFFLRVAASDRPGVLSRITGILGEHRISIASMIQHEPSGSSGAAVPLVIMTHACGAAALAKAVAHIDASDVVAGTSVCLSVLDE